MRCKVCVREMMGVSAEGAYTRGGLIGGEIR